MDVLVTVIGFFLGGPVGVGTIISAVGLGPLINLNFAAVRFNPAEVHQENAAETHCENCRKAVILRQKAAFFALLGHDFDIFAVIEQAHKTDQPARRPCGVPLLCPIIIPNALARHKLLSNL